jgi:ribosomal protein S18 acetylase RimI-like enzyme
MPRLDLLPFADEHLGAAGRLLAERHRRHREAEPLLPRRFENAEEARAEVEAAWRSEHASGAVALSDGRFAGYLIGAPRLGSAWGPNVWIELAGHAAEEPELVRYLYAAAAVRWVEEARTCHYALVPAADPAMVDAWFRLGFGQQHAHAVRDVPPVAYHRPPGVTVRRAQPADADAAIMLDLVLHEYQIGSPVFSRGPMPRPADIREDVEDELADPSRAVFLAEADGRPVGATTVAPVKHSSAHSGLGRPEGACILGFAATLPEFRGRGVGLALTEAVFEWARNAGYSTIVVDWRVTNLAASSFWPQRGFRTTFLRVYRSIP